MKTKDFIIGVDISKKTFDLALSTNTPEAPFEHIEFQNSLQGCQALEKWLSKQGIGWDQVLVCMENTGIYHRLLAGYLVQKKALVWVETPVQIKWSMGIQRGKNDAVDAQRIMRYAYRNQDQVKPYEITDQTLQQIADYLAHRERVQRALKALTVPINELKQVGSTMADKLQQLSLTTIQELKKQIKEIEKQIHQLIQQQQTLKQLYQWVSSIPGVGFISTTYLIVYTRAFTKFDSHKQLAAYAGVAPFEYSSGTSIKGKTKVHPMANKKLKTVLHMAAISAIQHNQELKAYFKRKVLKGKNKMSVINAIRNKIIARAFACVRNQRNYQLNYQIPSLCVEEKHN